MEDDSTKKVSIEKKYCPQCFQQYEGFIENCPQDQTVLRGPKNDPWIGKTFADRYIIESVLGLGGMSVVYKAKHKLMDRTVAIKMMHNVLKQDVTALERFKLEAQAASSLSHQNVITVYDFGVTPDGEPFFVMDCLEGESLKDLIERKGRIAYDRALSIFKQICEGLEAAHKRGIVHRDLKPANVIVTKQDDGSEHVRLVDFGIAKMLKQDGRQQQQLTKTGEVFGSPIYMSPEQCLGKDIDARSDIYALGCLMYETLSGEPPFLGNGFLETMNMHVGDKAKPLTEVVPDANLPTELVEVINRCMEKDPAARYQNVGEVRDTLVYITTALLGSSRTHISSISAAHPPVAAPAKKVPVATIVATVFGLVFVGVISFATLWPGPEDDRGTLLNKITWQMALSDADGSFKNKDYPGTESKLIFAESKARTFGDNRARLMATLKAKSDLYDTWEGHAEALEKTNLEITSIELSRVSADAKMLGEMLDEVGATAASSVLESQSQLRFEAQIPRILSTAVKLAGRSMSLEEDALLTKALAVSKKKLGKDSVQTARISLLLSDCYSDQRRFDRMRPLLVAAVEVYKNKSDVYPAEYAKSLAKLGQFDVDRTDMAKASPELEEALKVARTLKGSPEVLILCLRSNADFLNQTGKKAESEALRKEAEALEKQVRK
ncbi:MAG: Non-specific serine/threonine protein kinase [Cyanobacteriota bacterium erpe_2018_sw_21hr_WHONDRS-SW48-000092_B_bin.40]|jgi:serine/threonine protein kinase|nr:Non-specific serine/threonine protein kinase [Cyanobacteriota bacterium erpe_2018_sw_21hr_WHONDRS-SW48-000092_B_bin.40]